MFTPRKRNVKRPRSQWRTYHIPRPSKNKFYNFNKSNALSWALSMGLYAMPVIYSDRKWGQIVGDSYYIQLGPDDKFGWTGFALLTLILSAATVLGMVLFTSLTLIGLGRIKLALLEQYESLIMGILLCAVGLLILFFEQ